MEISSNINIPAPLAYSPEEIAERRRAMNRAAYKARYEANKEAEKARCKAYYQNNKEAFKARMKDYREANKEDIKAYYQNNKEAFKARNKAWSDANSEKVAASKKIYQKKESDETWGEIYKHLGTKCSCPTCTWPSTLALEVDHIIPRKKGPHKDFRRGGVYLRKYIIKNNCWEDFQLLCANCNKLKHRNGGICNCGDPTRKSR